MKRLKIVEQIIIVLVFAVLIPFVTIGIIISNVSQQSVRNELEKSAVLMAQFAGNAVEGYIGFCQSQLDQMASGFNYIPDPMKKLKYFNEIEAKTKLFKNLEVVEKHELPKSKYEIKDETLTLISPIDKENKYYLSASIDINIIGKLFDKDNLNGRRIYLFDSDKNLLTTNASHKQNVLSDLNEDNPAKQFVFGSKKNTPKVYYKIDSPDWFIVVDTTKKVTKNTITKARNRIVLSLALAALSVIVIVSLYVFYLYINIRQLFKGITAISKGNYDKKIHLIKTLFTPYETVFLAKEFNYMANKINTSYKDLRKKNKELERLNEFRENLVSSTSHEFRTPLTSIIGYTSRLLRQDITLDDETRIKSLKTIKQQAQRLSKMVEDLLVIPELDSCSLKFNIEEVDVADSINCAIEYLNKDEIEFICDISSDLGCVYADNYRLEQILINLIDNAQKYSLNNQPVKIEAKTIDGFPTVKITNKCENISEEIQEKLFEKFIRADSKLTRTTRGTGLGLYIVKGLADAMNIGIDFTCKNIENEYYFTMTLKFSDYVK